MKPGIPFSSYLFDMPAIPGNEPGWLPASPVVGSWLIADGNVPKNSTMGDFTNALKQSRIADTDIAGLPGSYCLLPVGVDIQNRFYGIVHDIYRKYGLNEYQYPAIVNSAEITEYMNAFGNQKKLLYVNTHSDPANRWILSPTGEPVIYTHWKKLIKTNSDLPVKMYRNADYFRAAGSKHTESIFKSGEASGIFEFHCCYENNDTTIEEVITFSNMLSELFENIKLPFICTNRPLCTNNHLVSVQTTGYDIPLPNGKSLQAASVYRQDDIFSSIFNIRFLKNGKRHHTSHLCGYISRRAIMAQLFLGLRSDNFFTIHPNLQPVQVCIICLQKDGIENELQKLVDKTLAMGFRVKIMWVKENREVKKVKKQVRSLCSSIEMLVLPGRIRHEAHKVILTRYDRGTELVLLTNNLEELADRIKTTYDSCIEYYDIVISRFLCNSVQLCTSAGAVKDALASHKIAVCSISTNDSTIQQLESMISGEILGTISTQEQGKCVINNTTVFTKAFISRRI